MLKQNPFSLYDFLGYLIPGALFYFLLYITADLSIPCYHIVHNFQNSISSIYYVPFIIISYVTGHILSYLSSLTIEKYTIWSAGYPSEYLHRDFLKKFKEKDKHRYFRTIASSKTTIFFVRTFRLFVALFLFPISFLYLIIFILFKSKWYFYKPLDSNLSQIIIKKITLFAQKEINCKGTNIIKNDFYRCIDHYVLEKATAHQPKFQNYVALYGFSRTSSFLMVLLFWIQFYFAYLNGSFPNYFLNILLIFILISFLLFLSFIKFYRRYTLESLMALVAIYPCRK